MATITVKRRADGTLIQELLDGSSRPLADTTDWSAIDALTDEQFEAAARSDAQPLSSATLKTMRRGPHPRLLRTRLQLSREEFAERYHIPDDVLEAWETHRSEPDAIARAYLAAIAADPGGVAKAVGAQHEPKVAAE